MRLLIVIGAGASYDSWPPFAGDGDFKDHIPVANRLFAPWAKQNMILREYDLMGLAAALRRKELLAAKDFDIEAELGQISANANKRGDLNSLLDLYKARFYLHRLVRDYTNETNNVTQKHTVYVDMLHQIKNWIDESPQQRFVDIVVFNYDTLIEDAMKQVYSHDWDLKAGHASIAHYYVHKNVRIFKPHGSINWGRQLEDNDPSYELPTTAFKHFNSVSLTEKFDLVDPNVFTNGSISKKFVPAIAIPFKDKYSFQECPPYMFEAMKAAIKSADKLLTLGWKGADQHFTKLIKDTNNTIDEAIVISPSGETQLGDTLPSEIIKSVESTFRHFVSESNALELLLNNLDSSKVNIAE